MKNRVKSSTLLGVEGMEFGKLNELQKGGGVGIMRA